MIGAGPAGVTVSDGLVRAGATVILAESGSEDPEPSAQELSDGDADGPIVKDQKRYLKDGRWRVVGGSTSRWGPGWCMPFRELDYAARPWVAMSGWPLGQTEIEPYETLAATTFGFDSFAAPVEHGPLVRLTYRFPPEPQVMRSIFFGKLMRASGFRAELDATAVELEADDGRVTSVRFARRSGGTFRVVADRVVLAAGAIENARLLLMHEPALGPLPELTGRCFMEHPHVLAGMARLTDLEGLESCLQKGDGSLEVLALDDIALTDKRLFCASVQLRQFVSRRVRAGVTACELFVRAEQAPNPDSRVLLGDATDRFGSPRPMLEWRLLDRDWTSIFETATLVAAGLQWWNGAETRLWINEKKPWPWPAHGPNDWYPNPSWGNHHLGTTRMATGPADGVVDLDCRVFGTENLYAAGSSVFPTGSAANPTFMIVALAHRLAAHLVATG